MRRKGNKNSQSGKEKVPSREPSSGASDKSDVEYEVEAIIDKRKRRGKSEYLVRWKGFLPSDDTWEAADKLSCPNLIESFEKAEQDDDIPLAETTKTKKRGRPKNSGGSKSKKSRKNRTLEEGVDEDEDKEYEVSKIIEVHYKKNGDREFLVRWKGYSKDEDTWEPEKNLSCNDLIEAFMKKVAKAKEANERETRFARKATDRYVVQPPAAGRKLSGRTRGPRRTYYEED